MALANKKEEKKKYQGGPKRKSYLKSMASKTGRPMGEYMKFGDFNPEDVHQGATTFRGHAQADAPGTNLSHFSRGVKINEGKKQFIFQDKLYRITDDYGVQYEVVQV